MANRDYDEGDEYSHQDDYYDSHDDDDLDDYCESDGDDVGANDPLLDAPWRPVVRWTEVKIGEAILDVSSEGKVKPHGHELVLGEPLATEGVRLPGTPFRTYTVEIERGSYKTYYMHDIVYQAFHGKPPPGYEVRHVAQHTMKPRSTYSNRLGCLTIVPIITSELHFGLQAI